MKDQDRDRLLISIQGIAGGLEANLGSLLAELRTPASLRAQSFDATPCKNGVSDPTGQAVATAGGIEALREFDEACKQAFNYLLRADQIRERFLPPLPFKPPARVDGPGPMWCKSCWRDNKHCEPISDHYARKGLCRWCGDFLGEYGRAAPVEVLEKRHRGQRISQQEVERAIVAEDQAKKHNGKKAS